MAKQKLTLDEFKAAHPFCCFCGGTVATFDKIMSRHGLHSREHLASGL